ncbi:hypothetical protein MSG_03080 [Mycobacterium shigaense]|uniref:eCIS core domain-containing protein n=1 Tax=Mycobacterium shigaense TaxID=722731 RepID=A0A1Z4EJY3_9MYCO|nr:hypothetical protein MSG_03080 [Mycobacterium shigaense]
MELVAAAAVPFDAARERAARPAQLIAPDSGYAGAASKPLVVADRSVRLLSLGGAATDRLLSRIAADMGAAVARVDAFWGVDWSRDVSVVATGTDEQFRAAAGGGPASQWADIAAVTVADQVDAARRVALGQRIVFAPGAATMSASALRIVLAHELFHYAARVDTVDDAPRWITEGVADFVARPSTPVPAQARAAYQPLPSDIDLNTPGPQRSLAYDRAWWFARFVADTYGTPKLRAYYLATCRVGHTDPLTAAHDVLGVDPAGLLTAWTRWMVGGA